MFIGGHNLAFVYYSKYLHILRLNENKQKVHINSMMQGLTHTHTYLIGVTRFVIPHKNLVDIICLYES